MQREGIVYGFRTQRNVRVHSRSSVIMCAAGFVFGISRTDWMFVLTAIFLVLVTELMNTAVGRSGRSSTSAYSPACKSGERHRGWRSFAGCGIRCSHRMYCVLQTGIKLAWLSHECRRSLILEVYNLRREIGLWITNCSCKKPLRRVPKRIHLIPILV